MESRQLADGPEGSQNLGVLCNAGVRAQMLGYLSTPSGRGLEVRFPLDDASENFGFMQDLNTLSAVPCDSQDVLAVDGFLLQEVWHWNKPVCNVSDEGLWFSFLGESSFDLPCLLQIYQFNSSENSVSTYWPI